MYNKELKETIKKELKEMIKNTMDKIKMQLMDKIKIMSKKTEINYKKNRINKII